MKLTKEKLKEIILEEIQNIQEVEPPQRDEPKEDEDVANSLSKLRSFLLNLSKESSQLRGASPAEIEGFVNLVTLVLNSLQTGEHSKHINFASNIYSKRIGQDK